VPARDATGISLAAVGATSAIGFVHRLRLGQVEVPTGIWFAVAGMAGAPLGSYLASLMHESVLLILFAGLMVTVASRLWLQAARSTTPHAPVSRPASSFECPRDHQGALILSARSVGLLLGVGLLTGVLAGLFGVGGGFVIVPALVLFTGMEIHRAVGTSLMVVAWIGVAGVIAHVARGRDIALELTGLFVLGGVAGLFVGQRLGQRLPAPTLQKVFALAMIAVAAFVIWRQT
jgi:uncharacterized membrane protein YfcA